MSKIGSKLDELWEGKLDELRAGASFRKLVDQIDAEFSEEAKEAGRKIGEQLRFRFRTVCPHCGRDVLK